MSKKSTPPIKKETVIIRVILAIVMAAAIFYFSGTEPQQWLEQIESVFADSKPAETDDAQETLEPKQNEETPEISPTAEPTLPPGDFTQVLPRKGSLSVLVLDVGQGDSIFVMSPEGKTMLIDTGERDHWQDLNGYLQQMQVTKLDALVGTHPHSDHIGAMQSIVENYEIGNIYMPRAEHTSKTYINLLEAIQKKKLKIKTTKGGDTQIIPLDDSIVIRIFAPLNEEYESLNNFSIVLQITYGDNSILLTADAETMSEGQMGDKFGDALRSSVLKVGHHGSTTSTSARFLKLVDPTAAIISCGKDNDYGHPHEKVVSRLEKSDIDIYRTDTMGTVAFFSDGQNFEIVTER